MRGVPFAQIPTTRLAMVDSSVGGKVGIDLPEGKNLVGGFKPPEAVYVCVETLSTLPKCRLIEGMAEVIKYGAIMDADLFDELKNSAFDYDAVIQNGSKSGVLDLIKKCIRHKASVVERDEYELTGLRATLNFGHTVAHAIEKTMNYEGITHGESVAIGMVVESRLGKALGYTHPDCEEQLREVLGKNGLKVEIPGGVSSQDLLESMRLDKKVGKNGLAFAFIQNIGTCKLYTGIEDAPVLSVLNEFTKP